MTTIVKAASAAQFLALVPRMLGYRPSRSLVIIPFEGSRSLGAMRIDLPDDEGVDAAAATIIGMVCRLADADAALFVVYCDDSFESGMPRTALVKALRGRADACGIRVSDALCVGADAWGSYLDADLPTGGRELAELADEPGGAEHLTVAEGDQATGASLPQAEAQDRADVERAFASLGDAVDLLCGPQTDAAPAGDAATRVDPLALSAACSLDDLPRLFEDALRWDPDDLPPYDAAVLVWCLSRPALRDIALVEWCGGLAAGDEAFDAQLRWEAGEEYPAHLAMHMWGEGARPDPGRLERGLALARRVAALAPDAARPGPLATCAWLAWALGRSTHAERYALTACELEPEHGLAEIVRSFVLAGHLPDWAFRRR